MTPHSSNSKLKLSVLAMALTCLLSGTDNTAAQENSQAQPNSPQNNGSKSQPTQPTQAAQAAEPAEAAEATPSQPTSNATATTAPATATPAQTAGKTAATGAAHNDSATNALANGANGANGTTNAAGTNSADNADEATDANTPDEAVTKQTYTFDAPVTTAPDSEQDQQKARAAAAAEAAAEAAAARQARAAAARDHINQVRHQRLDSVTKFATNFNRTMVNNVTTDLYMRNPQLAASSTFPQRLITRLRNNPWRPAPHHAVPEKDLACYYGIPAYREPLEYDTDTTPITISADAVDGSVSDTITYQGNVIIEQGDRTVQADEASYDNAQKSITTQGNITYQSSDLTLTSHKTISGNLESKVAEFEEPIFQLNGSVIRGNSQHLTLDRQQNITTAQKLSMTTCPIGDNSWHLESNEVELDHNSNFGSASGNVLYFGDMPVFYLPYVTFPIKQERKSGLLYPSFALSTEDGFEYEQPIYFNIAPNYDYTLSPRIMTKRGLLLKNEFRYMPIADTQGIVELDYIYHDNNWDLDHSGNSARYMFHWQHDSYFMNRDLHIQLDYQRVRERDYDYINDIGARGSNITDDHLRQSLLASYNRPNYEFSIEARDYQRLLPDDQIYYRPFALLPQLKARYYDTYGPVLFNAYGEVTRFSSTSSDADADKFSATRIHFEPDLGYQIINNRGTSVSANVRGFFSYYEQDDLNRMPEYYRTNLGFTELESTSRNLFLLQLKGKTTLERKVLDLRHTQTLEPEIQYQYIPYKDQSNIALYDSTDRMNDYYSNFSFRRFTGYDRIPDLNRVSLGLTSRLLDAHDREIMRVGVSQSYAFEPTRVTLTPNDYNDLSSKSQLSSFLNMRPFPWLTMHAAASYSTERNEMSSWNAMAQYRNEKGLMVQVSYRFAKNGNRSLSNNIIDLQQIGLVTEVPINNRLSASLATYRDVEQDNNIDTKFAIKYEECCWSLAFVYENYNSCDWDSLTHEQDHRIGIQFEFKGIGAVNIAGNRERRFTDTSLLNYFDPTNLNQ